MAGDEFIWKCMKLCDGIGIYMMVYGCISAHKDVYASISGWIFEKVIDGYKPSVPSTPPPPPPKLSSPKLL